MTDRTYPNGGRRRRARVLRRIDRERLLGALIATEGNVSAAARRLKKHRRQVQRLIRRFAITTRDVPGLGRGPLRKSISRDALIQTLRDAGGDLAEAANRLGVGRTTVRRWIDRLRITPSEVPDLKLRRSGSGFVSTLESRVRRKAAARLRKYFRRNGYCRLPSPERRKEGQRYKKGYEVRLVALDEKELNEMRLLLAELSLPAGRPYRKHARIVQPVYGRRAIRWFCRTMGRVGSARRG